MLAAGAVGLAAWLSSRAWAQASFQAEPEHDHTLVVIFLRGGADGLNFIVPHGDDDYHRLRPTLRIGARQAIDLDGFFGLHPSLEPLEGLFKEGRLAGVHAVGSQDQTRSHFEAMAAMEKGQAGGGESDQGGWLARHILATPGRTAPLRAVALSATMPDSLGGALSALAVRSIADHQLRFEDPALEALLAQLYSQGDDAVAQAGRDTLKVLQSLMKSDPRAYRPSPGAEYPDTDFGRSLREAAYLRKGGFGLEVACLDMGLWDTHVAQGGAEGWMAGMMAELAKGIAAFIKDLGHHAEKTTVLVQTEFGRRAAENSGFGTDHGRASIMLLAGGGVKGGKVHADWPGLKSEDLEGPGDLRVTADYRQVLAEVLRRRLASPDIGRIFPGLREEPLGLIS
jgi:uncharacterized protein (DUF1501 family)